MQMANGGENLVYKHPEDNWFEARVNIYCKLSNLTVIRDAMDRVDMLRRWEQGVFMQFLKMDKEFFSGKLCHILLCKELNYPGARPNELWFRVGEHAIRFGKEEFLLVTGLRFGPMPVSVHSIPKVAQGSVHHQYFGGSPTPLKDILDRLSRDEFDEAEDVIKLGYVYFLSHVMLGQEYRWKVPDWIWGLVKDITAFEAFPWGTYIYSVTIYWLVTTLNDRTKGRKQNRNYSSRQDLGYYLYGFPWAFMYWVMGAIPVLSGSVGKRRRGRNGHGFPRLTRWYCRKKPSQLEHKFTDELEAYTTLTPTAEERLQEYYRQFNSLAVVGPELHMHGALALQMHGNKGCLEKERIALLAIKPFIINATVNGYGDDDERNRTVESWVDDRSSF
ncbi:hypothetical protein EZV62_024751 [Acer yangbiense]|uniref:DUF1985 domain-containing protein n=1 Tax=Acer yangbiense TaxID=1000413 RepID=A0A5C7GXT4_9ROSI|nr:hypothetical protein EZV62_024751 [Acer yangbiense]